MAQKEYISVDRSSKESAQTVKLLNSNNEFAGTLKTKIGSSDPENVNNVFLQEIKVNNESAASTITGGKKTVNISVPTKTSDLTNDAGFITIDDVPESGEDNKIESIKVNGIDQTISDKAVDIQAIQKISLRGWGSGTETEPGDDGGKIEATPVVGKPGEYEILLKELEFDELRVQSLYLADKNITDLIPNLEHLDDVGNASKIEEGEYDIKSLKDKYNDLVQKFNLLLSVLKGSLPTT